MRNILIGLAMLVTMPAIPLVASAQGQTPYYDSPQCQPAIAQYEANPEMVMPERNLFAKGCIRAYQLDHPQQTLMRKTGGMPAGKPYYYERWTVVHPSDNHNGMVYADELPPLVPYLKSRGLTEAQIAQWAPFITQNHCSTSVAGMETACFQVLDDNGVPSDSVTMTDDDVSALLQWMKIGYPFGVILKYTATFGTNTALAGLLLPSIDKDCPHHTFDDENFTKLNPYQTLGQCEVISARVFQVLGAHTSLVDATPGAYQLTGAVLNYGQGYSPNKGSQTVVVAECYKITHAYALSGSNSVPLCRVVFDIGKWQASQNNAGS